MFYKTASAIATMRAWLKRRRARGDEPNADEMWARIKRNWPDATEDQQEAIFQASN